MKIESLTYGDRVWHPAMNWVGVVDRFDFVRHMVRVTWEPPPFRHPEPSWEDADSLRLMSKVSDPERLIEWLLS